jgi:hypothetical protein
MTVHLVKVVKYTQKIIEKLDTEVVMIVDSTFTKTYDTHYLYLLLLFHNKFHVFTS